MPSKLNIILLLVLSNLFLTAQDSIPLLSFTDHQAPVNSIDISPDGNFLISGSKDESLKIWDLKTQKLEKTINTKGSSVKRVCFNSTGTKFLGALYSQFVEVDFKTFKGKFSKKNSHTAFVETCLYSNDGNYILTSSWRDNALSLWKANSLKKQLDFEEVNWIDNAIFNSNTTNVISGGHDNLIKVWDVATGKMTKSLAGHDDWVYDICLSKDEKYIYSGSFDKTIKIWDISSGKNIATLKEHTDEIVCLDLSKDGKYLASAGMDKYIIIWDIANKTIVQKIKAHSGAILDVKFNKDATMLYSCSIDKTIKCWKLNH